MASMKVTMVCLWQDECVFIGTTRFQGVGRQLVMMYFEPSQVLSVIGNNMLRANMNWDLENFFVIRSAQIFQK